MLNQLLVIAVLMISFSQGVGAASVERESGMNRHESSIVNNQSISPLLLDNQIMVVATCDSIVLKQCKEDCNTNYSGCISGHDDKQPCAKLNKSCHRSCAKIAECDGR